MPSRSRRLRHTGADSCHSRSGSVSTGRRGRCSCTVVFMLHANLVLNLVYSIIRRLLRLLMRGGVCVTAVPNGCFHQKWRPKGLDRPLLAGCMKPAPEWAGTRWHSSTPSQRTTDSGLRWCQGCLGDSNITFLWEWCLCGRLGGHLHSFVSCCSESRIIWEEKATPCRNFKDSYSLMWVSMMVDFKRVC